MTIAPRGLAFIVALSMVAAACAPISKLPEVDPDAAKAERAKQRELVLKTLEENRDRVRKIAWPILRANLELCGDDVALSSGFRLATKWGFGKEYRKAAERLYGIGDHVTVISVTPGSLADQAGLEPGDRIVSIDGWKPPRGKRAIDAMRDELFEREHADRTLEYVVERDGQELALAVATEPVCNYPVHVESDDVVNAYADGDSIVLTTGMVRFAQDDTELATVIGHEIAHNLMEHTKKKAGNAAIGLVFDLLAAGLLGVDTSGTFTRMAGNAFSQEFEAEADYVGLYLMARAGYDIAETPNFWRRIGAEYPASIKSSHTSSHPSTPERYLALEQTVAEITTKNGAGDPLVPEKRERRERGSEPGIDPVDRSRD